MLAFLRLVSLPKTARTGSWLGCLIILLEGSMKFCVFADELGSSAGFIVTDIVRHVHVLIGVALSDLYGGDLERNVDKKALLFPQMY